MKLITVYDVMESFYFDEGWSHIHLACSRELAEAYIVKRISNLPDVETMGIGSMDDYVKYHIRERVLALPCEGSL
jgi:hypothetical protein